MLMIVTAGGWSLTVGAVSTPELLTEPTCLGTNAEAGTEIEEDKAYASVAAIARVGT